MKVTIKNSQNPFASLIISRILSFMFSGIIGGFIVTPAINFWLNYFNVGKTIPWIAGAIIGIVPGVGDIAVGLSLITYILHFLL